VPRGLDGLLAVVMYFEPILSFFCEVSAFILSALLFTTYLYVSCLLYWGIERGMIKNVYCLHVKYPFFLSDFN
jgi:hypothetical protein